MSGSWHVSLDLRVMSSSPTLGSASGLGAYLKKKKKSWGSLFSHYVEIAWKERGVNPSRANLNQWALGASALDFFEQAILGGILCSSEIPWESRHPVCSSNLNNPSL